MISVIDDDASIRAGLDNLVRSLGYVVCTFDSAEAFLQSAELRDVWCVIADVRMPPTQTDEGLRAALEIRSRWPDVGIVVLSQYVEERYAA